MGQYCQFCKALETEPIPGLSGAESGSESWQPPEPQSFVRKVVNFTSAAIKHLAAGLPAWTTRGSCRPDYERDSTPG
jgi:hypothetical protein